MLERDLHIAVCQYLAVSLPPSVIFWHTPNGEKRDPKTAKLLKAMGVKAGIPDLLFLCDGKLHAIELKADKKNTTPEQKSMHMQLRDAGCPVMVCRSLAEIAITLQAWEIPSRGRIAA